MQCLQNRKNGVLVIDITWLCQTVQNLYSAKVSNSFGKMHSHLNICLNFLTRMRVSAKDCRFTSTLGF